MKRTATDPLPPGYPLAELCALADLPLRTARHYIQIGLVDRPEGETRAARYGLRHLAQLLLVKKWTAAGVSLDRIRNLLRGDTSRLPPTPRTPGSLDARSHLLVADGIEVVIEPARARLTLEQVRQFVGGVMATHVQVSSEAPVDADRAGQQR